jgi:Ca2+-binding EF-hand superfamily protein
MHRTAVFALVVALGVSGCGDDEPDVAVGDDVGVDEPTTVEADDIEFATLDANGDSYLDVDEVAEWADDAGIFSEWDVDGDSELDRDEITGNAFELWDADANGTISEDEWETGVDVWYPDDAEPVVFDDLDNDGDSELDADEFSERVDLSPVGETWTAESLDAEAFENAYFELYDKDGDGKVSETEWTTGVAAVGTPNE